METGAAGIELMEQGMAGDGTEEGEKQIGWKPKRGETRGVECKKGKNAGISV